MNTNPYRYGGPVSGSHFVGREAEVRDLVSRMTNGVSVVVTAPRRYGKTSLVMAATGLVELDRGCVVSVNLLHCPSLEALAERLVSGAFAASGTRTRRAVNEIPDFLRRLRLQPAVSFDDDGKPTFSFGALAERDALRVLDETYEMLAAFAEVRPAVLVLDEFQAVGDLGGGLAPALKALGDEYPGVSLVIAGSRQHLMEALVLSPGAPLYNMAERLALGPIDQTVMIEYLVERAAMAGKSMSPEAATRISLLAGPVPYDVQRLAYEVFEFAGGPIGEADVDGAMSDVVRREESDFVERFAREPAGHRRVLVEVAARMAVERPYSSDFARQVGYAGPPGVRRAVVAMLEDEILARRAGLLVVADPFFAEWLRRL